MRNKNTALQRALALLLLALSLLTLNNCANPESESGLYDVKLNRSAKLPVDGYWFNTEKAPYSHVDNGSLYIAPVCIGLVYNKEPEVAPLLANHMNIYLREEISKALVTANKLNNTHWTISDNPATATVRLDISVVELKMQRPLLRSFGKIGSLFVSVPVASRALDSATKGKIVIEATTRDVKTGKLLAAFKDHNRKDPRFYEKEAYTRTGVAEKSLQAWAHGIGNLIVAASEAHHNSTSVKQMVDDATILDGILWRMKH